MNSTQWRRQQDAQDAGTSLVLLPACLAETRRQQQLLPIVRLLLSAPPDVLFPSPISLSLPIPGHVYYPPSSALSVVCSGSVNVKFDSHLGMHVLYSRRGEGGTVHRFAAPTCIGACFRFRFSLSLPLSQTLSSTLSSSLSGCVCIQDDCIIFAG